MPAFTKSTKFSDGAEFTYEDMRAHNWTVKRKTEGALLKNSTWTAFPTEDTAKAYGLRPGSMFSAASDAEMLIDGIEERLEAARLDGKTPGEMFQPQGNVSEPSGFPWWLLAVGVLLIMDEKKKGGRWW
jgi:hypothetical protein